jgi:hypothetical protein
VPGNYAHGVGTERPDYVPDEISDAEYALLTARGWRYHAVLGWLNEASAAEPSASPTGEHVGLVDELKNPALQPQRHGWRLDLMIDRDVHQRALSAASLVTHSHTLGDVFDAAIGAFEESAVRLSRRPADGPRRGPVAAERLVPMDLLVSRDTQARAIAAATLVAGRWTSGQIFGEMINDWEAVIVGIRRRAAAAGHNPPPPAAER